MTAFDTTDTLDTTTPGYYEVRMNVGVPAIAVWDGGNSPLVITDRPTSQQFPTGLTSATDIQRAAAVARLRAVADFIENFENPTHPSQQG
jgi:hypothetical protein